MRVDGTADLPGPPGEVFPALMDRDVLQRCIPGCERLDEVGERRYEAHVRAGVGSVKGRFKAVVTISDVVPPEGYRMGIEAKSPVGHVRGEAEVALSAAGAGAGSLLRYEGEARVSGMLAAVGQRLLLSGARRFARDFFARLAEEV